MAAKPKRIRWNCPTGTHPGILGPTRPPKNSVVRYCLPCSETTGRLVERVAPALETKRATNAERQKAKAATSRQRAAQKRADAKAAETARYSVEGVDLRSEMARLVRLRAFGGVKGPLASRLPQFTVTRRTSRPGRYGFAEPWANRIHMAIWPGCTLADARETLVHELTHLYVGEQPGSASWHGDTFWRVMDRAFSQAYGVDVRSSLRDNRYHGRHAKALAASEGGPRP
jgi:hypothetical protein